MKILFPIIALLLVGCKKSPEEMVVGEGKKSPEEMFVGEWKRAIAESNWAFKFRADGVVETDEGMGDWEIVDGKVAARIELIDGRIREQFFDIKGPSKLVLRQSIFDDGQGRGAINHDPPLSFYRVVE